MRCSQLQEQYLEFSTVIPASSALYGLGERSSSTGIELRRDGIPLALWNHDSPAAAPDQNVYGSHPILMEVREGEAPVLGADLCLCCCLCPLTAYLQPWCVCAACLEWASQSFGFLVCRRPFPALHLPCRTHSRSCSALACCVRSRLSIASPRGCCADSMAHGNVIMNSNGKDVFADKDARDLTLRVLVSKDVCADGTAHGIVLLNSNGMDVSLTDTRVTWHVTGGVIDLYFLMGPTPFDVLDQLTQIIGRPMMPPFWSLGLMNSKCAAPRLCM